FPTTYAHVRSASGPVELNDGIRIGDESPALDEDRDVVGDTAHATVLPAHRDMWYEKQLTGVRVLLHVYLVDRPHRGVRIVIPTDAGRRSHRHRLHDGRAAGHHHDGYPHLPPADVVVQ